MTVLSDNDWDHIMSEVVTMSPQKREQFYRIAEADGMPRKRVDEIMAAWLTLRTLN
jgi:hypothetical protein